MKRLIILIVAMVIIAGITYKARAKTPQVSTPAGASLVAPISIERNPVNNEFQFGVITITDPTIPGYCVYSPWDERTFSGGVTGLPKGPLKPTPVPSNALYIVKGTDWEYYQLILPETITIFGPGGDNMIIDQLQVLFNGNLDVTPFPYVSFIKHRNGKPLGSDYVFIGGTLTVKAYQHEGVYTGTFAASVEYN